MDNRIKNIMKNMEFTTPATTEEINAAEKELGLEFPKSYVDFLLITNGAEGSIGEENYLVLWSVNEIVELNNEYAVLLYYIKNKKKLGFSDGSDKNYPEVTSEEEIKKMIELETIVIPLAGIYDGRSVAMAFHCDWDAENGLGVLLVNEKITSIGYQDIAF